MKTERTQIHFLYNVFLPLRPQILKSLLAVDRDGGVYFQLGEEGLQTGPSGPSLQGDRGNPSNIPHLVPRIRRIPLPE